MKIRDYFSNDFETSDTHYISSLRTRYYRARNTQVREVALELIKSEEGIVKSNDEAHYELIFDTKYYSATFTIISTTISETAIDIKINTYSLVGMGKGKKAIERMYAYFDSKLPFKGVGLFKG